MPKKLLSLLDKRQKTTVVVLLGMMVIGALLETVVVSMVLPLVSVIMTPDMIHSNKYLKQAYDLLGCQTDNSFLVIIICALIAGYIIKNSFLFFMYYAQAKFVTQKQFDMSRKLLSNFMNKPYEYYLNASTAVIIRIIQGDVANVFALLNNVLQFMTELFVAICLVLLLVILDPVMTVTIMFILGVTMIGSKLVFQKGLSKAGGDSQKSNAQMNQWLIQGLQGIKDIKIFHREAHFISQYEINGQKNANAQRKNAVLSQAPRLLIEATCMCGMLGIVAVMLINGRGIESMMAQVAAFAMAAVRLMPSANRMNTYLNAISFLEPSLNTVYEDIETANMIRNEELKKAQDEDKNKKRLPDPMAKGITLRNITYSYPQADTVLFSDAQMKVPVGKSVAIIGTSGAGKTTVVDIMLGLLKPSSGNVLYDDIDVMSNYADWLSKIGYIPQKIFLLDGTIRDNIAFGIVKEDVDEERIWKVLEDAQLAEHVKGLPEGLDTEIGEKGVRLSGGQGQRLGIARALYHDPDILVFDEATSALDDDTEAAIMESIQKFQGKKTMIIIAHRLGTIKDCDLVYRVGDGTIKLEKGVL